MDQGQAPEGSLALILVLPEGGVVVVVDDGLSPAGRTVGAGIAAQDQIVQGHVKILGQGGQVVHVRPGRAALPLLHRLAGDAHHLRQVLLTQPPLPAQAVEPVLKLCVH